MSGGILIVISLNQADSFNLRIALIRAGLITNDIIYNECADLLMVTSPEALKIVAAKAKELGLVIPGEEEWVKIRAEKPCLKIPMGQDKVAARTKDPLLKRIQSWLLGLVRVPSPKA